MLLVLEPFGQVCLLILHVHCETHVKLDGRQDVTPAESGQERK